jgi:aminoglycoside phosphotransferase
MNNTSKKYFYFPPYKKQFYFSEDLLLGSKPFNYIYAPYTWRLKLIWTLWRRFSILRNFFKCKINSLPKLTQELINTAELNNMIYQINTGTSGEEQKTTIYAYSANGTEYFIKGGKSKAACNLIENEALILNKISSFIDVPKVEQFVKTNGLTILMTEAIKAKKITDTKIDLAILQYIVKVSEIELTRRNGYIYCFSHGDCCPWNLLKREDESLVLIDWELAGMKPLGYDLLTYIFRTSFLVKPEESPALVLRENSAIISKYYQTFGISKYERYINLVSHVQVEYVKTKGSKSLIDNWTQLALISQ